MEDITGIGKLADSKLAASIYDDAVSPAVKELGAAAADLIKTLRLFTAPFQLAATAQDRFARWLDEVRHRVPEKNQVEAPPSISGPALRAMLFLESDNPMAQLFLNLLTRAINRDTQESVHPGFVRVLEQINPDEALLLQKLGRAGLLGTNPLIEIRDSIGIYKSLTTFPQDEFSDPDSICMYFEHLETLALVAQQSDIEITPPKEHPEWKRYRWYAITLFGSKFLKVCGQQ